MYQNSSVTENTVVIISIYIQIHCSVYPKWLRKRNIKHFFQICVQIVTLVHFGKCSGVLITLCKEGLYCMTSERFIHCLICRFSMKSEIRTKSHPTISNRLKVTMFFCSSGIVRSWHLHVKFWQGAGTQSLSLSPWMMLQIAWQEIWHMPLGFLTYNQLAGLNTPFYDCSVLSSKTM